MIARLNTIETPVTHTYMAKRIHRFIACCARGEPIYSNSRLGIHGFAVTVNPTKSVIPFMANAQVPVPA
jgi:hypothetical protein